MARSALFLSDNCRDEAVQRLITNLRFFDDDSVFLLAASVERRLQSLLDQALPTQSSIAPYSHSRPVEHAPHLRIRAFPEQSAQFQKARS